MFGLRTTARWALLVGFWLFTVSCAPARAGGAAPHEASWTGQGTWAFEPARRLEGGPLDLRHLNEGTAGEHGFVRRSEDGADFVRGDGRPIRFWGVAAHANKKVSDADLTRHARFLARMGANMVRVGGASPGLIPQEKGAKLTDVNAEFVDTVWRTVAAMKKEGIYVRIAPFWDHGSVKYINPEWGLEGYNSGDRLNGLLFFEPTLQRAFKRWMKHLMTEENPYTGLPLRDDPAVAIVQIVSEDSLLFWWLQDVHGGPLRELQRRFAGFARGKYGSLDEAYRAWNGAHLEEDAGAEGRLALYPLYNLTEWPGPGNPQRLRDQTEFLGRLERNFYLEMKSYLEEELGLQLIVGPSNFHSADPVRLDDLQRWAWTAGDVIELNDFFSGTHRGPHSFWRTQAGHFVTHVSATRRPELPPAKKQVAGHPFILSSTTWIPPNLYTTEGPLMSACYAAMNGVDGLLWFAAQAPVYDPQPYFTFATVEGSHPMKRWSISHPGFISQFPAAALIYRLGLVERAATVVHEERSLEALFQRRAPMLTDSLDYDPAAYADQAVESKRGLMERVDPLAMLTGRVEVAYGGDPADSRVADLSDYINHETGEVRTTHGQLVLNHERGLLRIDAPAAQGVVGFLRENGGQFRLSDLEIHSSNHYASLVAVAADGKPLRSSGKVLVQTGTTVRPTGWQVKPATREVKGERMQGYEIVSTGRMPWRVRDTHATLTIANESLRRATVLDEMGFGAGRVAVEPVEGGVRLELPPDAMYVVLSDE